MFLVPPYLEHSYSLMYANAFCFKAPLPLVWCYPEARGDAHLSCIFYHPKFFLLCITTCPLISQNVSMYKDGTACVFLSSLSVSMFCFRVQLRIFEFKKLSIAFFFSIIYFRNVINAQKEGLVHLKTFSHINFELS